MVRKFLFTKANSALIADKIKKEGWKVCSDLYIDANGNDCINVYIPF